MCSCHHHPSAEFFSSCKTGTLHPSNSDSPSPPSPSRSLLAGSEFHGSSRWDRAVFVSLRLAYFPQPNVPGVPPRGSASEQPSLSRPTGVAVRASRTPSFQRLRRLRLRESRAQPLARALGPSQASLLRRQVFPAASALGVVERGWRFPACSGWFHGHSAEDPASPASRASGSGPPPGFLPRAGCPTWPLSQPVSQDGHAAVNHTHVPGFPWFPLVPFSVPGPHPGRHCPLVVMAS